MILEAVNLEIIKGKSAEFEAAFSRASPLVASIKGYISHELLRCLEREDYFLLLIQWQNLEAHTVGFRGSPEYAQWKVLLHPFYDPFPDVLHYEPCA